MPLKTIGTGRGLMGGRSYASKVLGFGPIAYWPLWEASGTVAECLINPAQNGTYNADVSGWPPGTGIGDGNTAPYFSNNDLVNIYSVPLNAAFDGQLGSAMFWARVPAAAWTDATTRIAYQLRVDGNNFVRFEKNAAVNWLRWYYVAGAVVLSRDEAPINTTAWMALAITWNRAANRAICYRDGVQIGAALAGLGVWAGALDPNRCAIGSDSSIAPSAPWVGWVAHAVLWDRELTPGEVAVMATV